MTQEFPNFEGNEGNRAQIEAARSGSIATTVRRLGALTAISAVSSLGAAVPARGAEIMLDGKPGRVEPEQTWDETSKMPSPPGPLLYFRRKHPERSDERAAISFGTPSRMFIDFSLSKEDLDGSASMRKVFDHEIGHQSDYLTMTIRERATFNMLRGSRNPGWRIGVRGTSDTEKHDSEVLAEARATCARWPVLNFRTYDMHGYGDEESIMYETGESHRQQKRHRDICKFLKRAMNPSLGEQGYTPDATVKTRTIGSGKGTVNISGKRCDSTAKKCVNREVDSNQPAQIRVKAAKGSKFVGFKQNTVCEKPSPAPAGQERPAKFSKVCKLSQKILQNGNQGKPIVLRPKFKEVASRRS